jgi:alpha-galactosidase
MPTTTPLRTQNVHTNRNGCGAFRRSKLLCMIGAAAALLSFAPAALAQVNGIGARPYQGWSTFSEQTISNNFMNQQAVLAQSDAMRASGLQAHGFEYINIDGGWTGASDQNGRTLWNTTEFPNFLQMIQHIHANGQKFGLYLNPGIGTDVVAANPPILGTPYHIQDIIVQPPTIANAFGGGDKIDYTKPGAQEYINSVIDLYASWGVDFIKLDAVTPGSFNNDLTINNIPDVMAMSKAIAQSRRPIWLTISWALDEDFLADWQQFSNARRIEGDVECEGDCPVLTEWPRIEVRFLDLPGWEHASGPTVGWNDLDSLEIGNGTNDGITDTEQQTAMTLWAIANAPLSLGGDLTQLTSFGKKALTNDEVLAVDQSGHPATQINAGFTQVWASNLGNGAYYVALFNLNALPSNLAFDWKDLGFQTAVSVRDLWSHTELGPRAQSISAVLPGHGARLFRVQAAGHVPAPPSQSYEGASAVLHGSAMISPCSACSGGSKLTFLGIDADNFATFTDVEVKRAGTYRMQVDSITSGTRSYIINVNGGPNITLNSSGGSTNLPSSITIPVKLNAGINSIEFGNPVSFPPDLDRIVISGDGNEPYPDATTYEGEYATLSGSASGGFCGNCSGLAKAGNLGGGASATFTNVNVPAAGTYNMEIDYLTSGPRSFFLSVNDGASQELYLNGTSFNSPASTVIPVRLSAGNNTIAFSNPTNFAPDLDSITISPVYK